MQKFMFIIFLFFLSCEANQKLIIQAIQRKKQS